MSHGHTTTKWVRESLPELEARGRDVVLEVIERAIQDTRAKRFWVVLITILLPAMAVNLFHAEIADVLGGKLSRFGLLAITIVISAIAASRWPRKVLHERICKLAQTL